jgi:transposase
MKACGLDLRKRIVIFVNAGGSKVEAAKRFGVARKTVYNYSALVQAGALAPKASWGGWKKFDPDKVRAFVAKHPDARLWEIGRAFHGTDVGALSALRLLGLTLKKTRKIPGKKGGAAAAVSAGTRSLGGPGGFLSGRMRRGTSVASGIWPRAARERLYAEVAGSRRHRTSILSVAQNAKLVAPFVFEGSCNTEVVDTGFEKVLLPALPKGSGIVLDNARFHQAPSTQKLVADAGCELLFLPTCSPDLNPIEPLWAKLKAALRRILPAANDPALLISHMCKCYSS